MSDAPDKESKTEAPSDKKVRDTVEKGNVPFSPEVGVLSSFSAFLVIGLLMSSTAADKLAMSLAGILENAGTLELNNSADALRFILTELKTIFLILFPVLIVVCIGGVIGPLAQNVPQANLERLTPKMQKLSPAANFNRIFGKQGAFDFLKMLLKVLAVTGVSYWALKGSIHDIFVSAVSDIRSIPATIQRLVMSVLAPLTIVALLIAIIDIVFVRLKWFTDIKMTKQELKDEHKQSEGDPYIKERIRATARQRLKSRMMADLPKATLVIANPTHYAVALRYVPSEGGAPLVIAKGIDHLALRIRSTCEELGTPVIENKALARSLYAATDVGTMIPADFYRAVAEIIHFVELRKKQGYRATSQA
ncbi:MAG: flagellar type III secretion system protein FlhB [Proteobacteria bacterium]|nr:flagellar type III secretion system protein FlhB [Pseudomonadota bacterium]